MRSFPKATILVGGFAEIVEQARLIKQVGFNSIWGGEHHVTDGFHYFPLMSMLQRLAPEAEGLEIGTNIVLLPLHNPDGDRRDRRVPRRDDRRQVQSRRRPRLSRGGVRRASAFR